MHIDPLSTEEIGLKTLEKRLIKQKSSRSYAIGIPKESSLDENRLCLTPSGVEVLVANGHQVLLEKGAGTDARFADIEYADAGAQIVDNAEDVFRDAEIIAKVSAPTEKEVDYLQPGQILISTVHLGSASQPLIKKLLQKQVTALAFEFIKGNDGVFPLVRMMHEITGSMSIQIAAHYMETTTEGQGKLLGGISGIPPATVVILGAGTAAEYAARTALGYGAQVIILDTDLAKLRNLENALDRRVITAMANQQYLLHALKNADIVIGAVTADGDRSPCLVTEEMVQFMKSGSVIVDTVIDQGGCIASSKMTSHSSPIFEKFDIVHYCVPNIPSKVARTATYAINNVMVPYLLAIGDAGGIKEAIWDVPEIRNGIYTYRNHITKKAVASLLGQPYRDIEILVASQI